MVFSEYFKVFHITSNVVCLIQEIFREAPKCELFQETNKLDVLSYSRVNVRGRSSTQRGGFKFILCSQEVNW